MVSIEICILFCLGLFLSANNASSTIPREVTTSNYTTPNTTVSTTTTTTTTTSTTTAMPTSGNISTTEATTEAHTSPTESPLPTLDGYEYLFQENETDFKKCLEICGKWEGDLVSIHSQRENSFIMENVTVNYDGRAWIGLQRLQSCKNLFTTITHDSSPLSFCDVFLNRKWTVLLFTL